MTGLTDYSADNVLNYIVGKTAMPSLPTTYLALFTAVGGDSGSGFTEVSGNNYSRVALSGDWNSATGDAPSTIANGSAITFPTPTGSWGTIIAWGIYDSSNGGNLLAWDYLGAYAWLPVYITAASPAAFDAKGNGYSAGDAVVYTTEYGGAAPSFSQSNLSGLLAAVSPSGDTFTITNGGVAVNTSSTGSGMVRKVAMQSVAANVVISFASSALTLSLA
jgi:hypothetical protein